MFRFTETSPFNYVEYFVRAAQFLAEYKWIFCYNNTKFIRNGVLEELPRGWINDLNGASNEEFNQIPVGFVKETWSDSFQEFLRQVKKLQVQYDRHDKKQHKDSGRQRQTRKGINAKKAYEIDNLCSVIESVQCPMDTTLYIDFGSGLGYLSELIHERCDAKVLGIEGNAALVQKCNERSPARSTKAVQYCHHFITEDSYGFIEQECNVRFGVLQHKAAVVGLHACADLSITAINCFLQCKWAKSLTIMPCCYHRLKPFDEAVPNKFLNFPLSQELQTILSDDGKRGIVCRSFLRLACQQTSARWKERSVEQHVQHGRIMFRRGLIDAILEQNESVRVGKLTTMPEETTVDNMLEQFRLLKDVGNDSREYPWTDQHRDRLCALLERYGTDGPKLAEYVECLQTCLQSICESVILLDRMCYMESVAKQSGLQIRRNLVRLRDDGLSPRCFIVYASKDQRCPGVCFPEH